MCARATAANMRHLSRNSIVCAAAQPSTASPHRRQTSCNKLSKILEHLLYLYIQHIRIHTHYYVYISQRQQRPRRTMPRRNFASFLSLSLRNLYFYFYFFYIILQRSRLSIPRYNYNKNPLSLFSLIIYILLIIWWCSAHISDNKAIKRWQSMYIMIFFVKYALCFATW